MRIRALLLTVVASTGAFVYSGCAHAQASPEKSRGLEGHEKPTPKKTKVWTNEDLDSLRSPADVYLEEKATKAAREAKSSDVAVKEQPVPASPEPKSNPPRLSNPKTVEDADGMIAWEQRDIDSQEENIVRLQKELDEAPAEEKQHLQELIKDRMQIIAETKVEQQGLIQQKNELEKKDEGSKPVPPLQ